MQPEDSAINVIGFSCLHCGHRLTADGDRAGEPMACPNCAVTLTVPNPIGGRLTSRRLGVPVERAMPAVEVESAAPQVSAEEPNRGFHFEVRLPKILGHNERGEIQESAEKIIERLEEHLARFPQWFRSGTFVLEVERLNVDSGGHDARLRLFGAMNHTPFNSSISICVEREAWGRVVVKSSQSSLIGALILAAILIPVGIFRLAQDIEWLIFRRSVSQAHHRQIQKRVVRHFRNALDEAADRPLGVFG